MDDFLLNNCNTEEDFGILRLADCLRDKRSIIFTTSGTTSNPKLIEHDYQTLVKNIKIDNDYKNSVWGLTYYYDKIAASQVILQSYLNNGKIVNLLNKSNEQIIHSIQKYEVTHLSATPTFYRMLTNGIFNKIKQVTVGGETVDRLLISHIQNIFPNAKITNVYALTEFGTLFSSNDEFFSLSKEKSETIKIADNHIFVMRKGDWLDTGDIVEFVDDHKFRIIGRASNMINVGGYKVNPIKIESIINNLNHVKNCKVYGIGNSVLGNIIAADIITDCAIDKEDLTSYLKQHLNKYEVPLKINIVDKISTTSTGKILRK